MRRSFTGLGVPAMLSVLLLTVASAACQRAPATNGPSTDAPTRAALAEKERQQAANRAARAIDATDIRSSPVRNVEELFAGRFAGVVVGQLPSGGISVRIRGTSSVLGSNEPLYVIDGMPIDAPGGALVGLNPADIQRIEVLKDIGSTAFYGMRGANGVVLITTKRPN